MFRVSLTRANRDHPAYVMKIEDMPGVPYSMSEREEDAHEFFEDEFMAFNKWVETEYPHFDLEKDFTYEYSPSGYKFNCDIADMEML